MLAGLLTPGVALADQFRNNHWVYGAIDTEFHRLGFLYPGGPPTIGEPNSDELNANNGGKWQAFGFDTNRILWNANVDSGRAHQIGGLILQKWLANGDERGRLGYPITSESQANGGKFNHFEGGSIYFQNGATAAFIVQGEIRNYWQRANWENGQYGFPISDEYDFGGGKKQDFQRGSLYWNVAYSESTGSGQQLTTKVATAATIDRITPSDGTDPTILRAPAAPSEEQTSPQETLPEPTVESPMPSPEVTPETTQPSPTTEPRASADPAPAQEQPSTTSSAPSTAPAPQQRPFPAQAPTTGGIDAACNQGLTNPERWVTCTKQGWVLRNYKSVDGVRTVTGTLPYVITQSARYDKVTSFNTGTASWEYVASIETKIGTGDLSGGTTAQATSPCDKAPTKCGTGTVPTPTVLMTPSSTVTKTWQQYANGLNTKGKTNVITGTLGVTHKGRALRDWSHNDTTLIGRCDSVVVRTGCVNTTYDFAIVYDPIKPQSTD